MQSEEEEDDLRHKIDLESLSGVVKLGSFLQRDIWSESDHRDTGDPGMMTTGQESRQSQTVSDSHKS